ncbi:MAG TPA: class I SAM-dependent methyltransferase [Steroidobacteraceae bacterium]|nr:class I SAM-dependent methyltransferase [Steroidobacteraceae bacterium]
MREVVHWPHGNRLVYLHAKATPEYWDAWWRATGKAPPPSPDDEVVRVTSRYLPRGARLLEGGCGRADKVKSLAVAGYGAVGVDFAEDAVKQSGIDYPGIDVRQGDVRKLDFPDASFDGYWSIGVIEHFWDGYEDILAEAARVVKPEGILFLTAPWFSPYRLAKARRGGYQVVEFEREPESFYQFALPRAEVEGRLARHGFAVERWSGIAAEISMREDMPALKRQVEWLFGSRGSVFKRAFRRALSDGLSGYCGHSFLAIARRAAVRRPAK